MGAQVSDIKKCTDSAMPTHNLLCTWNPNAQVPFELDHAFAYVLGGLTLYNPGCGGGNMHACHWGKPAPKTAACRMQHALFWQTGRSDVGVARVMF